MTATEIIVVCVVGFGAALLGSLTGALTAALLELWKQVLAGMSAARVIRQEMIVNATTTGIALEGMAGDTTLLDVAWKAHGLTLAPLLSEIDLTRLYRELGFLPRAQIWIGLLAKEDKREAARRNLVAWLADVRERRRELRQVESSCRLGLFLKLLCGHRTVTESDLTPVPEVEREEVKQQ